MPRAIATTDAFTAVAEPRRREILDVLAGGERPVNDLVRLLGLAQPQVSKHLRVLREVGVVHVRRAGRERVYRLNGRAIKPIHDCAKGYEGLWEDGLADALDLFEQPARSLGWVPAGPAAGWRGRQALRPGGASA